MKRAALSLCLLLAACDGVSPETGARALFMVRNAQFVPGTMPGASGGPEVITAQSDHSMVAPGSTGERYRGVLAPGTSGFAIGLTGDIGYWVQAAKVPQVDTPGFPSFDVRAAFASRLPQGALELQVRAVDADNHFGGIYSLGLTAVDTASLGPLVFRLTWDLDADLDLRVVIPGGIEIWREDRNSYIPPPPGTPQPDPMAPLRGGILNRDSNAQCVIDSQREERVVWTMPPVPGRYTVRVDAFSMCGRPYANWLLEVLSNGNSVALVRGIARDSDTRLPHGLGAGQFAVDVDIP